MKKLLLVVILLLGTSIQAKERTVEDALANSKIAMKKIRAFEKEFTKDGVVKDGEKKSNYCKDVMYPPTAESFVKYACIAFQEMNWNEVYCYSSSEYLERLKKIVKKIKASRSYYHEKFSEYTCKTKSSKQTDKMWEEKEFTLEKMGTIKIDYMGDWKIIGLELR